MPRGSRGRSASDQFEGVGWRVCADVSMILNDLPGPEFSLGEAGRRVRQDVESSDDPQTFIG